MFKRTLTTLIALSLTLPAAAQDPAEGEKILEQMVPQCYAGKMKRGTYEGRMPAGASAEQITVESADPYCRFDGALVRLSDGRWYVGTPWPIGGPKATPSQKLKKFAWDRMGVSFNPRPAGREGNLEKLVVENVTEAGRVILEGYVDPAGTVFMMGDVAATAKELVEKRDARLAPVLEHAPAKGPVNAPITIVEFSDFQCPSCRHAHDFLPPILEAHKGQTRYIRIDLPLVSSHPWAFAAAVIGRAIYRQSPDAFWDWKAAVYSNQSDLNPFIIDEFGRNFAADHGLDMTRYDKDVLSQELKDEILRGVGQAYTIRITATPSFLVNGRLVSAGSDGGNMKRYLDELSGK